MPFYSVIFSPEIHWTNTRKAFFFVVFYVDFMLICSMHLIESIVYVLSKGEC